MRAGDHAYCAGRADVRRRVAEVRVIENIRRRHLKTEKLALGEMEFLHQREIQVAHGRRLNDIVARVADKRVIAAHGCARSSI